MTDVNQEFATERTAQLRRLEQMIEDGTAKRIPGGRIKIVSGIDAGEVFGKNGIPEHGLDDATGEAALAIVEGAPDWTGVGKRVRPDATVDEVMKAGQIDWLVVQLPQRWDPRDTPKNAGQVDGWNAHLLDADVNQFTDTTEWINVRSDTGTKLGTVGSVYEVYQNWESFQFLQELIDKYGVTWESAGATRGGRSTFVSLRLPREIRIDAEGVNDEILPFVIALNSHDGSGKFKSVVSPWRPVCKNTERFAVRDAITSWDIKHTKAMRDAIEEARRSLKLSIDYFDHWVEEQESLAQTEITVAQFEAVVADLWTPPAEDAGQATKKRYVEKKDLIMGMFGTQVQTLGSTAYAAERVFTEFYDNKVQIRGRGVEERIVRGTRLIEGKNDAKKNAVHSRLMALAGV